MKDFLFVFRAEQFVKPGSSPEEAQAMTKKWMDWIGDIAAQNKLKDAGNRLEKGGKVVKSPQVVTDGPYSEMKEMVGGYTLIRVETEAEAIEIAKGCPIFIIGGSVEVREISPM